MKGHPAVIKALNEALSAELTAINQFFIHSRMCADWGYTKLAKAAYDESIEEMKHAGVFIDRILFLDGTPNMQKYNPVKVGSTVKAMMDCDRAMEAEHIIALKKSIKLATKHDDPASRMLFEEILKDEEGHLDHLDSQLHLIAEIGIKNYLAQQI